MRPTGDLLNSSGRGSVGCPHPRIEFIPPDPSSVLAPFAACPDGGIGRHDRLKLCWPVGRCGFKSAPVQKAPTARPGLFRCEAPKRRGALLLLVRHGVLRGGKFQIQGRQGHLGSVKCDAFLPSQSGCATLWHLALQRIASEGKEGQQKETKCSFAACSEDGQHDEHVGGGDPTVAVHVVVAFRRQPKSPSSRRMSPMPMRPSLLKSPKHS